MRKTTKNRGHFPSDQADTKLFWLVICNIEHKRARDREQELGLLGPPSHWGNPGQLVMLPTRSPTRFSGG